VTEPGGDGAPNHVPAPSGVADERTRVLKHGDTFAVLDHCGDVRPGGLGEEGLYHEGTRFLSCLLLELEGGRPLFVSPTACEENDKLSVNLTSPDLLRDGQLAFPRGTLHLTLEKFLWRAALYQQLRVKNYGPGLLTTALWLRFTADFADIFEVSGWERQARGRDLAPAVTPEAVILAYEGLDGVVRRARLHFSPPPSALTASSARFDLHLAPQDEATFTLAVGCQCEPGPAHVLAIDEARAEAQADRERSSAWSCHLRSSNAQVNAWVARAASDLHLMTTDLPTGPYPYAGIPWFSTPFGRDGIITALECLWLRPGLARGVLTYLASRQATELLPEQDAEPGKILHETRSGEMAALKEIPFGRYYGSVDSTPLFVALAGAYYERTADRELIERLWPNLESALQWIERYGDGDGDGLIEYQRHSDDGLLHQGWKDSDDAICHADGSLAEGPIALCEVQGYAYAAWRAGAKLAALLGHARRADELRRKAEALRERFELLFWCDELSTYALALDGQKQPCRVSSSNAGQCLFSGVAQPDRARRVARTLLGEASFSGWGVRTLAANEVLYNPMGYHTGSVWPHDTALVAWGMSRYGLTDEAMLLLAGMFEAGLSFELQRMPELICGFERQPGEGPVLYPGACSPQAWASASVFLLLQACLGVEISALERAVTFASPRLPVFVSELRIHNLEVAAASVDVVLVRHESDVGVNVLRREGEVRVSVVK
jgi:glycogen debranching enzyme